MPITLRRISIRPDLYEFVDFDRTAQVGFFDHSRSLCNYLLRAVRKIKFETAGFDSIVIYCCDTTPPKPFELTENKLLITHIPFRWQDYLDLPKDTVSINEYMMVLLEQAFSKAASQYNFPYEFLVEKMEEFRAGGYVNEWEFKARTFREIRLKCLLRGRMTIDAFTLTAELSWRGVHYHSAVIMETPADEFFSYRHIKDIVLREDRLVVTAPYTDKAIWSIRLADIPGYYGPRA